MKRKFPNGPTISFPRVVIGRMFPSKYPFDPLAFNLGIARQYGDIAYFRLGPLRIYQLNHPELIRQILVEQAQNFINRACSSVGLAISWAKDCSRATAFSGNSSESSYSRPSATIGSRRHTAR
jgi:hypothetical protein